MRYDDYIERNLSFFGTQRKSSCLIDINVLNEKRNKPSFLFYTTLLGYLLKHWSEDYLLFKAYKEIGTNLQGVNLQRVNFVYETSYLRLKLIFFYVGEVQKVLGYEYKNNIKYKESFHDALCDIKYLYYDIKWEFLGININDIKEDIFFDLEGNKKYYEKLCLYLDYEVASNYHMHITKNDGIYLDYKDYIDSKMDYISSQYAEAYIDKKIAPKLQGIIQNLRSEGEALASLSIGERQLKVLDEINNLFEREFEVYKKF